jgi:plasmid stability protein
MGSLTIRDIDDSLNARLQVRAAKYGRSMEDGARDILRAALDAQPLRAKTLVDSIRARIEPLGGVDLQILPRKPMHEPSGL